MIVQRPVLLGVVFLTLVWGWSSTGCQCGHTDQAEKVARTPTADDTQRSTKSLEAVDVRLPDDVLRGVCLAHNWQDRGVDGYGTETSLSTLHHLRKLGVDTVSLTPFGWMPDLDSPDIRGEHNSDLPEAAEDRKSLRGVIEQAQKLDMHIILKPHIWIRGGEWRGEIEPTQDGSPAWSTWWENYREFALHYARIAATLDLETYVIGVELETALEARPEAFRELVTEVRDVYDGDVTYAANWNEELPESLWRELDSVAVQFYPPLTDQRDPGLETLRKALRKELSDWNRLARKLDLPLDITEVGYKSAATAVERPAGWPNEVPADARAVDHDLQKLAYTALFAELAKLSQLRSVSIWKYFTDPSRDEGGKLGFSPRGKPAEDVLRRAYRR